jgi:hypothetical protein
MNDPFDDLADAFAFEAEAWTEERTLRTPTFEAHLQADGTLYLRGVALREGFSPTAAKALTRFLSEQINVEPLPPPSEIEIHPQRVTDFGSDEEEAK